MIAEIIINTTAKRLQQTFTYAVPQGMDIHVGSRVLVPFGTRKEEGIVIAVQKGTGSQFSFTIKPILAVLSTQNGFQEEMIQTALWIHSYYLCSLADALRLFMVEKRELQRRNIICQRQRVVCCQKKSSASSRISKNTAVFLNPHYSENSLLLY